jgi:hypothetical protein
MESVMQPYEIRQFRDGTIDYSNYYARPVRLLTPEMHRFCREAMSAKLWLVMVATIVMLALLPILAGDRTATNTATPKSEPAQVLRERTGTLQNSDPQRWWNGYGKTTTRGQVTAVAELQRQLHRTKTTIAMR